MEHHLPDLNRRDDVEPSSAAGIIEDTYDSGRRPSFRMRREIAPHGDPRADDPGSRPHATGDEIYAETDDFPVEDIEGIRSRKPGVTVRQLPRVTTTSTRAGGRRRPARTATRRG